MGNLFKKIIVFVCFIWSVCSCSPYYNYFNIDVLDKNSKGIDIDNKTISVFSVVPQSTLDSVYINNVAISAAEKIEQDRGMENGSVNVFSIPLLKFNKAYKKGGIDSTFVNNIMLESMADIQVFIHSLKYDEYKKVAINYYQDYPQNILIVPYTIKMDIYDALSNSNVISKNIQDSIFFNVEYNNNQNFNNIIKTHLPDISKKIGEVLASNISKQWITQNRMIINFPFEKEWNEPLNKALDFKWKEAVDGWLPLTKLGNKRKAAYAAYNIAVALEIMEQFNLAKEWIDLSVFTYSFYENREFRNYLKNKTN